MNSRTVASPVKPAQGADRARQQLLAGIPVTERRIELAGISTAVLEGGSGPTVVLLHGPGEYAAKWFRIFPNLIPTNRVVAPDLPGHGTTYVDGADISPDRVLDWLAALLERHPDAVLVGHVIGGAIGARLASERPNNIKQLVLVDMLGLVPFQPAPEFGRALMSFVMDPNEETHDGLWERCAYDLPKLRASMGERWSAFKTLNLDRARVPAHQAAQEVMMQQFGFPPIPHETLAAVTVPTTLIWGRHDSATPLAVAQEASKRYGWPLHIVEDAADDPAGEQPEAFVQTLRAIMTAG
ncbi:MAG TPA: alpha/beta hydrolase [Longimicrobiales bacterium]|nr:alpha/beta hydrolase [Longimicrobiales bacterium]